MFAPNQQISLNDLESEERDIESFKRFSYFLKPPVNKPKVNFDLKNFMMANRKTAPTMSGSPTDSSPSPHYSETAASSMDDMSSLLGAAMSLAPQTPTSQSVSVPLPSPPSSVSSVSMSAVFPSSQASGGCVESSGQSTSTNGAASSHSGSVGSRADGFLLGMLDGNELKNVLVD